MATALGRAGIAWNPATYMGPPPVGGPQILAEVASPPLDSLASEINRRSLNLGAELLLQWAGGREQGPSLLTDHVRQITGDNDGVYLVDGSGLSYEDRVAPQTFVSYLAKFPATPAGRNFPQLLPANGTGTLYRLNSGFPGRGSGPGQDRLPGNGLDHRGLPGPTRMEPCSWRSCTTVTSGSRTPGTMEAL